MDYTFTANMEEKLDLIASGELNYVEVMKDFYNLFHPNVASMLSKDVDYKSKTSLGGDKKSNRRLVGVHQH